MIALQQGQKIQCWKVAERMYNIYYLMRRRGEPSSRVRAVVDFMVHFYVDEDLVHLTKNVAAEACLFDPAICTDHYRFIAEILKKPQIDKFREKIIKDIPEQIIKALELPELTGKAALGDESKIETQEIELTKEEIESGILEYPDDPRALTMLALELIINHPDRIEEAKAACKKAISIDSSYSRAWTTLGFLLHYKLKDFKEAEEAYRRAIEIDPEDVVTWEDLGNLLNYHMDHFEEAEEAYRRIIKIDPEQIRAWMDLGNLLEYELKRYEEAEKAYRRAIEIDPENVTAFLYLGHLLYCKLERYEEAEKISNRAIEIDPKDAPAWNNLGVLLSKDRNRYGEAERAYKRAIELEPTECYSWMNLIKFQFESLKNPQKALKTAEQFLKTSGRSVQNLNLLAWLFFKNGYNTHFEQAGAWSKEAVDKDKEKPEYQHTLAAILGGLGKWDESLKIAQQFLNNKDCIKRELKEITDYFITVAAAGNADKAIRILEQHTDIPALEPIIVGLKIFIGEEFLTAQEISEIGQDVAMRIKERMNA